MMPSMDGWKASFHPRRPLIYKIYKMDRRMTGWMTDGFRGSFISSRRPLIYVTSNGGLADKRGGGDTIRQQQVSCIFCSFSFFLASTMCHFLGEKKFH
jgi:hypothetical protein